MKPAALTVSVLALVLSIGGCVTYQPLPLAPEAELGRLKDRGLADVVVIEHVDLGGALPPLPTTFDPTNGLAEAEVVAVALSMNPGLRAERMQVGEATSQLIAAGLWPNPEMGFEWRPGIDGASGYNLEADALFQLLRPGERSARRGAAEARVDEVRADVLAAEFKTVADVRTQWLAVLVAEQSGRLLDEEVSLRERSADLVRQRRRLGEGTELELSVTALELAEVRRDQRKAQSLIEAERRQLNHLLGLPTEYALRLSDSGKPLSVTVFDDLSDDRLDRFLLTARPELRAKEAAYRAAEQQLRLAVLGQYPRLGIGPSFEREREGGKSLGLGLSMELPLLNQNQGDIAEKQAQRERLRAEYTALLHRLRGDAYAARAVLRRAWVEVDAQETEVLPLIRRNQELFEGAYRAREMSIVDWVTAQQRTVRARREYLDTIVRYRTALIRLESAVGQPLSSPATKPTTSPN